MILSELLATYDWPLGPWLRTNFVYGVDGSITRSHSSKGISGPADNAVLHRLRATTDVVLVGAATATAEDYIGVKLPDDEARQRKDRGLGAPPPLAVVTRSGEIGRPDRFLTDTTTRNYLILTSDAPEALAAANAAVGRSEGTMTLVHAPTGLTEAIGLLRERGHQHVLCEGGPRISAELLRRGLVDELCVTVSPAIGGEGRNATTPQIDESYAPVFCAISEGFIFTRWSRAGDRR
ncbi:MAG: dihydrofolate reductase family protein [Gordonia sp. (in: high G+C Gram-positive bacteria)]